MTEIALADRLRLGAVLAGHEFRSLLASLYNSPVYRWRFSGNAAERLTVAPQDLRTADPTIAAEIYAGRYSLAGAVTETGGQSPFQIPPPTREWERELHGFGWLRHLRAADTELARLHARALIEDWLMDFGGWHPVAWDAEVVARRLISWLSHSPLVLRGADHVFYRRFMRSLTRQSRYLHRTASDTREGAPRLVAAIALSYAGLCMAGRARLTRQASRWLDEELERQILPDGGHIGRNPGVIVELLLDLLPLRQTFTARDTAPSKALNAAIDRMMPMLRFFRHPDGALAHFNGMGPTRPDLLATILAYDDARGTPVQNASHSGYQRIEAGASVLIADSGAPPAVLVSRDFHAGCLSFEFSSGGERLLVNCGVPEGGETRWHAVARATAAHSTATLEDTSSCRFASTSWVKRRLGPIVVSGPRTVSVERSEGPPCALAMSHDGYLPAFGVVHERRLALHADGTRLDGEDVFRVPGNASLHGDPAYAIRFHLHPAVRASRTRDGERVVIASARGEVWEFSAQDTEISVEESIYLGAIEGPRRTEQIVLHGRCRHVPSVAWRLVRMERRSRPGGRRGSSNGQLPLGQGAASEG